MDKFNEIALNPIALTNGELVLANFEIVKAKVNELINHYPTTVITSDSEATYARSIRAHFNECIKKINRVRIDTVNDVTMLFENQCKEIESILDAKQKEFKKSIEEYDSIKKVVKIEETTEKPKKITATLKFYNKDLIKKLQEFAIANNCELSIK